MSSKRNKLLVKRGIKNIKVAPFSKPTKTEKIEDDDCGIEKNTLTFTGCSLLGVIQNSEDNNHSSQITSLNVKEDRPIVVDKDTVLKDQEKQIVREDSSEPNSCRSVKLSQEKIADMVNTPTDDQGSDETICKHFSGTSAEDFRPPQNKKSMSFTGCSLLGVIQNSQDDSSQITSLNVEEDSPIVVDEDTALKDQEKQIVREDSSEPNSCRSVKLSLPLNSTLFEKLKTLKEKNYKQENLEKTPITLSTKCEDKICDIDVQNVENEDSGGFSQNIPNNNLLQISRINEKEDSPITSPTSVTTREIKSLKLLCQEKIAGIICTQTDDDQSCDEKSCKDFSGTDSAEDYRPPKNKKRKRLTSSTSTSSSGSSSSSGSGSSSGSSSSSGSNSSSSSSSGSNKKGKKRKRNFAEWQRNKRKLLRNSGKTYISAKGKLVPAREMKPPCTFKCRLSCSSKFDDEQRKQLFDYYWGLSSLQRQRDCLSTCLEIVEPKVRRIKSTNIAKPRKPNCCFVILKDSTKHRVCKQFLLNTLGITERTLRTVIEAKSVNAGLAPDDGRGKHSKHSQKDPEVSQSVRDHINSIPRVESHYLRANTSREFVDGGLSIAELYRNYRSLREPLQKPIATYDMYSRIFNTEYNISFFVPKKDQCDLCEAFKNAIEDDKLALQEKYKAHQREKTLSREEKQRDIEACKAKNSKSIVAIYDLQAVMPTPIGESSAFFYKSKLNCYNFTVCDVTNKDTECFFWHEGIANRGAIEIGTCVFKFLQRLSRSHPNSDVIFYSDNCCGQQKNRFVFTMYHYAVSTLPINSITHKFLVRGHTQNEGDNAHSLIEKSIKRAKRSGPIYIPSQYAQIIRGAKKTGKPFKVHELDFDDFIDIKSLTDEIGLNFAKDIDGSVIKISEIKCIRFTQSGESYFYKTSYTEQDWKEVSTSQAKAKTRNRSSSRKTSNPKEKDIQIKPAYTSKTCITGLKKKHLMQLIEENIVPKQYKYFYDSLF